VKRAGVAIVMFGSLLAPGVAQAITPRAQECLAQYEEFQSLSEKGELVAASRAVAACGSMDCPLTLQRECVDRLKDLSARIPTIVVAAEDEDGTDLPDARVDLDGAVWHGTLDGREWPLDPGVHALKVTVHGRPPVSLRILAQERDKGRPVRIRVPRAPTSAPPLSVTALPSHPVPAPARSPLTVLSFVLGGTGLVALGTFAYFGATGVSSRSNLERECSPYCTQSALDPVRRDFLVADVSLGVSIVAIGAATILFFARPRAGAGQGQVVVEGGITNPGGPKLPWIAAKSTGEP
jgi:hypothetical protein